MGHKEEEGAFIGSRTAFIWSGIDPDVNPSFAGIEAFAVAAFTRFRPTTRKRKIAPRATKKNVPPSISRARGD
jgi:hypothetical protein